VVEEARAAGFTRRSVLIAALAAGAGSVSAALASPPNDSDDAVKLIKQLTGKTPTESDRIHLVMPRVFPNGYTVPLTLLIDSPMTEADHVRHVHVLAPRNPLIVVATSRCPGGRRDERRCASDGQNLG
jgi:sulfur-oxidizing protein SoxY